MKKTLYTVVSLLLLIGIFSSVQCVQKQKVGGDVFAADNTPEVSDNPVGSPQGGDELDMSALPPGTVAVGYQQQQLIGMRTEKVKKGNVTRKLRLLGKVAPDENSIFTVRAAIDGIIRTVHPSPTGSIVKKGQPLVTYYSPDIYAAKQAYLIALTSDRYRYSLQVPVNESKLQFLGMSVAQIEELKAKGEIEELITVNAPGNGIILFREVSPDLRFEKGAELYRIAALEHVWIYAYSYEGEARYFKPKMEAKVSNRPLGIELRARVSDVLPLFDANTRALAVRLDVDNPEYKLRPDMFVDIEIPISFPNALTVPADAVLDSGLKKTVFIDLGNGMFQPREVETGWRFENLVEIKSGLKEDEKIVTSGTFLIDSESRLEMASAGMVTKLQKDPISGLNVSITKAEKEGRKTTYKGKVYYFSSDQNREQFEKNPDRYLNGEL